MLKVNTTYGRVFHYTKVSFNQLKLKTSKNSGFVIGRRRYTVPRRVGGVRIFSVDDIQRLRFGHFFFYISIVNRPIIPAFWLSKDKQSCLFDQNVYMRHYIKQSIFIYPFHNESVMVCQNIVSLFSYVWFDWGHFRRCRAAATPPPPPRSKRKLVKKRKINFFVSQKTEKVKEPWGNSMHRPTLVYTWTHLVTFT